jgi:hypothetical protein
VLKPGWPPRSRNTREYGLQNGRVVSTILASISPRVIDGSSERWPARSAPFWEFQYFEVGYGSPWSAIGGRCLSKRVTELLAKSQTRACFRRTVMSFFTSDFGSGESIGKRSAPEDVTYAETSFFSSGKTERLWGR